ncbi:MAG: hypothetical protein U0326_29680 [Polyangiales bacterium]
MNNASTQRNGTPAWTIAPGKTVTITAGTSFDMTAPNFNLIAAMTHTLTTPDRQETGAAHALYGLRSSTAW